MIEDLACAMYLLAHDDVAERPYHRARTELLVRTAALIDLALRGRLVEEAGVVVLSGAGAEPTGAPVLDGVLRDVGTGHGWKRLARRHRKRTLTEVEDRLAETGLLAVRTSRTLLGKRRLTVTRPAVTDEVRARVSEALRGDTPVRDIPAADAALLALAAAGDVRPVLSPQDRRTHRDRIDACTRSLAALAPGLAGTVHDLPMTMIAAQGGMGGS
ncbi:GPP34 family phosphoprotein [Streptomyces sp. NPDC102365]|uniref:GOLPH3/VPS74 family protein n=1 Tax=Streptomyces sp. NPDC102365 TaxID=3366162 RepID=UPI00382A1F31